MKSFNKNYLIKISLNVGIFIFSILIILSGIIQVTWYVWDYYSEEPFYIIWNYGLWSYPYNSRLGSLVNLILSFLFLSGVFMQLILYKDVGRLYYIFSIGLIILGLFGCFGISQSVYLGLGEKYSYSYLVSQTSAQVLPGFFWGLLLLLMILVKKGLTKILP
ncbi:MAG: hypothetical protein ACXAAH_17150, partial [Promethearchaeota archaeon]